jgi:hypothetical protein
MDSMGIGQTCLYSGCIPFYGINRLGYNELWNSKKTNSKFQIPNSKFQIPNSKFQK